MNKKNTKSENPKNKPESAKNSIANKVKNTSSNQTKSDAPVKAKQVETKQKETNQTVAKSTNVKQANSKQVAKPIITKAPANNDKTTTKQNEVKVQEVKKEVALKKEYVTKVDLTKPADTKAQVNKPLASKQVEIKPIEPKIDEVKSNESNKVEVKSQDNRPNENRHSNPTQKHNNSNISKHNNPNQKNNNFQQNQPKHNQPFKQNLPNNPNAYQAKASFVSNQQSIKSMTGYSKTTISDKTATITVELRSLNGRNLELNCRLPRTLNHKEIEMREIVRGALFRGSISLNITIENETGEQPFGINFKAASEVYNALNELKKNLKIKDEVKLDDVLQFATQFVQKVELTDEEMHWTLVNRALTEGLQKLNAMRLKEGNNIQIDLENRVKSLHELVKKVEVLGIERIPVERERIRQKITQLFENDDIDEQRLQTEIVLMADKLDISEECVRLHSHVKHFFEILKERNTIGQKLTFLLQEMHREINTIGSKVNDTSISHLVVSAKEEIERIREQVQNVE